MELTMYREINNRPGEKDVIIDDINQLCVAIKKNENELEDFITNQMGTVEEVGSGAKGSAIVETIDTSIKALQVISERINVRPQSKSCYFFALFPHAHTNTAFLLHFTGPNRHRG
jgi:hypothetical protein